MKRVIKDGGKIIISVYSEKAQSEREKMYKQIQLPITKITNGKFIFGTGDNMVSEQFSIQDIKNIVEPMGLKIDDYEEVKNLAYIFTLKVSNRV